MPEHKFPCGHVFCECCCTELGQPQELDCYLYSFTTCPLCVQPCAVSVRIKPPTAGARVLTIDGGGIRAVIPIQFLRALEAALGLDMPVQEHFDFAYGTSSGSMVIMALFGLGMKVEQVHSLFMNLAQRVFKGRTPLGFSFIGAFYSLVASCRHGQFPAEDIDKSLFEMFGDTTMMDHPYTSAIGARIGFPIVDVDSHTGPSTCLVTSYNGAGQVRDTDTDGRDTYRVLRSGNAEDQILARDAVRCSSAAPWYFTPHQIPEHGQFMDGGM
ncbi:FabD/lysophospholipase-like protein, partial [Periconia macrospinosa]